MSKIVFSLGGGLSASALSSEAPNRLRVCVCDAVLGSEMHFLRVQLGVLRSWRDANRKGRKRRVKRRKEGRALRGRRWRRHRAQEEVQ